MPDMGRDDAPGDKGAAPGAPPKDPLQAQILLMQMVIKVHAYKFLDIIVVVHRVDPPAARVALAQLLFLFIGKEGCVCADRSRPGTSFPPVTGEIPTTRVERIGFYE